MKMSQAAKIIIADAPLRWQDVVAVARFGAQLELSGHAWARIDNAQAIVQRIVTSGERAYGVNTGLGALCNVSLKGEQLSQLSRNTLLSHACGVGPVLSDEQTRAIIARRSSTTATANPACTHRWCIRCWRCSTTASRRRCRP